MITIYYIECISCCVIQFYLFYNSDVFPSKLCQFEFIFYLEIYNFEISYDDLYINKNQKSIPMRHFSIFLKTFNIH